MTWLVHLNEGMDTNLESKKRNAPEETFNKVPKVCFDTILFIYIIILHLNIYEIIEYNI